MPYNLEVHADNSHANLIVSEMASDGIDGNQEEWFKLADADQPECGGTKKLIAPQLRK
ncbi:MAG: hypothetical protein GY934_04030 [Gammaproteobacteria bacterium]|nr:hypothetical protein [Gammaproteobacteria bacterium]